MFNYLSVENSVNYLSTRICHKQDGTAFVINRMYLMVHNFCNIKQYNAVFLVLSNALWL